MFAIWTCVFEFKNFSLIRTREMISCKLKFRSLKEQRFYFENEVNLPRKFRRW
ncbi:hypothetical protein LEP1GSC052_3176 [Leptospira kmetyi serovar Malaysia str. Bejo-Iso9]|nr:hypothetical protein LEP1GSC052_3176 [Leptospira kmetyi serovar Malaysia str. Bejo-Iso9]